MKTFAARYAASFGAYLVEPDEANLQVAYELGREAVERGLSVLDLAIAHHAALRAALADAPADATVVAAEAFLLESVATFEMVQRGFREAQDLAALQQRHAEMLRRLSDFLADATLALEVGDSMGEILRLVCEESRELASANCCLVTVGDGPQSRPRAASHSEDDLGWRAFTRWVDLSTIDAAVRESPTTLRITSEEARRLVDADEGGDGGGIPAGEWLGVALRGLDGRQLGALHLIEPTAGTFTRVDEAVVSNIGQMAASAIERAVLYARFGPPAPSSQPAPP